MRIALLLVVILIGGIASLASVAAETCGDNVCDPGETCSSCPADCGACPDPCATITCEDSKLTCPDKYVASCPNTCSEGKCGSCVPSCEGHQLVAHCGDNVCDANEGHNSCPQDCPDPCATITCEDSKLTCPDDFVASCSNTCSNGVCSSCPPDCKDHQKKAFCGDNLCDSGETKESCPIDCGDPDYCGDGKCNGEETANTCPKDCGEPTTVCGDNLCDSGETKENCPTDCKAMICGDNVCDPGENCLQDCPNKCGDNVCDDGEKTSCPGDCGICGNNFCDPGEESTCPGDCNTCGNNICDPGEKTNCPGDCRGGEPYCGDGKCNGEETKESCHDDCGEPFCGNGRCDSNEDEKSCPNDCGEKNCPYAYEPVCGRDGSTYSNKCFAGDVIIECHGECPCQRECPESFKCSDGSMIACNKIGGRCECPCPAPENCEKRVDENGFTHIICKDPGQECPKLPQGMVQRCIDEGGRLVADRQGDCLVRECVFEKEPPPFYGRPECPDPAGIEKQEKVCKDMGQEFIITFDQGCKIGKCIDKWQRCDVDYAQIQQEKRECEEGGKRVFPDFTEEGCEKVMCVDKDACIREISPGFARHCQQKGDGGEAIAHRNSDGCIEYMDCVHRGERNIEYRQVGELPDPTKLLSIALKLEEMSMKFEEIKRKILALADYAKSIGSEKDERRYRSAANMVGDTRGQLERIKSQLRGRRGEMSKEEFERIINELREVVYESTERIAWALLSDGAGREFEGERREYMPEEADEFLKAFDLCVPNQVITPPDTDEVTITILGPGDNACKWNVLSREGPPGVVMEMTCESSRRDFEQMGGGKPGLNEVEEWGCTGPMADALKSGDLGPQEGQQQEQYQKQYKEPGPKEGSGGSCSGCLDNGICDPGECSDCKDCIGGMK